jgi:hypothetical protein
MGKRSRRHAALAALPSTDRAAGRAVAEGPERPPARWGAFPVSEIAIVAGLVLLVAGFTRGDGRTLLVGLGLIVLATLEQSVREHVTGFRSHAALLALVPTVLVHALAVVLLQPRAHPLLFVTDAAVFAATAYSLTVLFRRARRKRQDAPSA